MIAERLHQALTDDALVDRAASDNWVTVCERLDQTVQKSKAVALYDEIFSDLNTGFALGTNHGLSGTVKAVRNG